MRTQTEKLCRTVSQGLRRATSYSNRRQQDRVHRRKTVGGCQRINVTGEKEASPVPNGAFSLAARLYLLAWDTDSLELTCASHLAQLVRAGALTEQPSE